MRLLQDDYDDRPLFGPWNGPETPRLPDNEPIPDDILTPSDNEEERIQSYNESGDDGYQDFFEETVASVQEGVPEGESNVKQKHFFPEVQDKNLHQIKEKIAATSAGSGFMCKLFMSEGIIAGIIMSEVLGPRKGAVRRRG